MDDMASKWDRIIAEIIGKLLNFIIYTLISSMNANIAIG